MLKYKLQPLKKLLGIIASILVSSVALTVNGAEAAKLNQVTQSHIVKPTETNPAQLIDALNQTFGKHAGARASHAKGVCASGEFTPDVGVGTFVTTRLFSSSAIQATVRFSIGGGNPNVSDKSRTVRGMSVRLNGAGETYDLVLISEPAFFAATPESFVSFLAARVPDADTKKPDPKKIADHNVRFPEGKIQPALLATHAAPLSYASTQYHSNNAFSFKRTNQPPAWARIIAEPVDGVSYLTEAQEKDLPDLFLEKSLRDSVAQKPIVFTINALLPDKSDSLIDSTQVWTGKARVALGKLTINAITDKSGCDAIVFLPMQLPQNVVGANDPILKRVLRRMCCRFLNALTSWPYKGMTSCHYSRNNPSRKSSIKSSMSSNRIL